jgi:hypothetical protein
LQAGGHRFDPGWLHSRNSCKTGCFDVGPHRAVGVGPPHGRDLCPFVPNRPSIPGRPPAFHPVGRVRVPHGAQQSAWKCPVSVGMPASDLEVGPELVPSSTSSGPSVAWSRPRARPRGRLSCGALTLGVILRPHADCREDAAGTLDSPALRCGLDAPPTVARLNGPGLVPILRGSVPSSWRHLLK